MSLPLAPKTIFVSTIHTSREVLLQWGRYSNGRLALLFHDPVNFTPLSTATVNLINEPLGEDETFIRGYNENEGLPASLAAAGIIERTGQFVFSGFIRIERCRWLVQPETGID